MQFIIRRNVCVILSHVQLQLLKIQLHITITFTRNYNSNKLCGMPPQYAPAPVTLTFNLLTLKVVFESRVTWATSVPILVFHSSSLPTPLCSRFRPDVRSRQTSDSQTSDATQHNCLMPPPRGGA